MTPQRHKIGSTEFTLDDNILTIIAGDDKPIKCVYAVSYTHLDVYKRQEIQCLSATLGVSISLSGRPVAAQTLRLVKRSMCLPTGFHAFILETGCGALSRCGKMTRKGGWCNGKYPQEEKTLTNIRAYYDVKPRVVVPKAVSYTHLDVYKRQGLSIVVLSITLC